jgi:DNA mismatch repair protein MutL
MENAIDAKADTIKLIIKDAGRTLIQVIDNGIGMSEIDARMSFERHATSKIKKAEDLFNINTMGFRGEALASIAAIAHVELKTKRKSDSLGTRIIIEGSQIKENEKVNCPEGSSFAVKNLFYNVPARRNFLKSNQIELKHIMEEFERVALAYPEISFSMYNNEEEVYKLDKSNFKQRIIGLFGNSYNQKLLHVEQKTGIVEIFGYVCKPEFSKKVRGEQYFFVNRRFIKSNYLNNAIQRVYEDLIKDKFFPSYFINLIVDPKTIDVNIHPTKTEIKFEEEKNIYILLHSAVKEAIGKFGIVPSLDFDANVNFSNITPTKGDNIHAPTVKINPSYNPFNNSNNYKNTNMFDKINKAKWEELYEGLKKENIKEEEENTQTNIQFNNITKNKKYYQLLNRYIIQETEEGLLLIDQEKAHQRILYEKFSEILITGKYFSQKLMFPYIVEFNTIDYEILKTLQNELLSIGIEIIDEKENKFSIHSLPNDINEKNIQLLLEEFLENYKNEEKDIISEKREKLAKSIAISMSIKSPRILSETEINNLMEDLFSCQITNLSPSGEKIIHLIKIDEIKNMFY